MDLAAVQELDFGSVPNYLLIRLADCYYWSIQMDYCVYWLSFRDAEILVYVRQRIFTQKAPAYPLTLVELWRGDGEEKCSICWFTP